MIFEDNVQESLEWVLEKCNFEYSTSDADYICRLKLTGKKILCKKYKLHFLLKNLLFPLSEKFIFVFNLVSFIGTCERIDNFLTGSRNPIKTLNQGMNTFFQEILTRADVTNSMTFILFFKLNEKLTKASLLPLKELIKTEIKAWDDEFLVHRVRYDSDHRVLVLNCKLSGMFANFGRIWSVIEKVNLSAIEVYHVKQLDQGKRVDLNHKLTFMSQEMVNDVNIHFEKFQEPPSTEQKSGKENTAFFTVENKENEHDPLNESVMTISDWHQE